MFAVLLGRISLLSASLYVLLQYPGEPWYVIGHSMGAAMATLCALDLRFRLQPVPDVSAIKAISPGHQSVCTQSLLWHRCSRHGWCLMSDVPSMSRA